MKEEDYLMRKALTLVFGLSCALTCIFAAVPAFAAADLTIFGAAQHQGQLTLQGTLLNGANVTQTITGNLDPRTFGVFGIRYGHGSVIGGEHTFAYVPNFIASDSRALFYHSNLRVQAPFPVIKPYGTAGLGWIFTSSKSQTGTTPVAQVVSGIADIGSKFAINYGGGVKILPTGPVGVQFDVRGYMLPSVSFNMPVAGQTIKASNQSLNFFQAGLGVVFRFGE
jgi:opacity protein-like surface antigen